MTKAFWVLCALSVICMVAKADHRSTIGNEKTRPMLAGEIAVASHPFSDAIGKLGECTGTIIGNPTAQSPVTAVLTAAHCDKNLSASTQFVTASGTLSQIQCIKNQSYQGDQDTTNDLMICFFKSSAQPITTSIGCLSAEAPSSGSVRMFGYGNPDGSGTQTNELLTALASVKGNKNGSIVAEGNSKLTAGDSGGPVIADGPSPAQGQPFKLVAINSAIGNKTGNSYFSPLNQDNMNFVGRAVTKYKEVTGLTATVCGYNEDAPQQPGAQPPSAPPGTPVPPPVIDHAGGSGGEVAPPTPPSSPSDTASALTDRRISLLSHQQAKALLDVWKAVAASGGNLDKELVKTVLSKTPEQRAILKSLLQGQAVDSAEQNIRQHLLAAIDGVENPAAVTEPNLKAAIDATKDSNIKWNEKLKKFVDESGKIDPNATVDEGGEQLKWREWTIKQINFFGSGDPAKGYDELFRWAEAVGGEQGNRLLTLLTHLKNKGTDPGMIGVEQVQGNGGLGDGGNFKVPSKVNIVLDDPAKQSASEQVSHFLPRNSEVWDNFRFTGAHDNAPPVSWQPGHIVMGAPQADAGKVPSAPSQPVTPTQPIKPPSVPSQPTKPQQPPTRPQPPSQPTKPVNTPASVNKCLNCHKNKGRSAPKSLDALLADMKGQSKDDRQATLLDMMGRGNFSSAEQQQLQAYMNSL